MAEFNKVLHNAFKTRRGSIKVAAAEMNTYPQYLYSLCLSDMVPRKDNAKRLCSAAIRCLNTSIQEHMDAIKELQRLGAEVRKAYTEAYEGKGQEENND